MESREVGAGMKIMDIFTDDKTKQFSLGRLLCFLIIVMCMTATIALIPSTKAVLDIPVGWAGAAAIFYGVNKLVSNITGTPAIKANIE
jgi:hypothetical protein